MARRPAALPVVVAGCCGRMGSAIVRLVHADPRLRVAGAVEVSGHSCAGEDIGSCLGLGRLGVPIVTSAGGVLPAHGVLIDFTAPRATMRHLRACVAVRAGMVIGTTGLSAAHAQRIRRAARHIPIVWSPNMSIGVNLLFELTQLAAERLGPGYQVEIVESHHSQKRDAPSGTALRLGEVVAGVRGVSLARVARHGRSGRAAPRTAQEIGFHAVRAADIVGEHTVLFAAAGERVELSHRASSRDTFARGALQAAAFLRGRRPGLYDLHDVLRAPGGRASHRRRRRA